MDAVLNSIASKQRVRAVALRESSMRGSGTQVVGSARYLGCATFADGRAAWSPLVRKLEARMLWFKSLGGSPVGSIRQCPMYCASILRCWAHRWSRAFGKSARVCGTLGLSAYGTTALLPKLCACQLARGAAF